MSVRDLAGLSENCSLRVALAAHEPVQWRCVTRLRKYWGDWSEAQQLSGEADAALYEERFDEGNLLMTNGANDLWTALIGGAITVYSNPNAAIGTGDSSTAAVVSQNDMQAATNKVREAMMATFPSVTTNSVTFQSNFPTTDGNWGTGWQEWGVFNSVTPGGGHMLNRKVQSLGTKVNTATWQFAVTLSLS